MFFFISMHVSTKRYHDELMMNNKFGMYLWLFFISVFNFLHLNEYIEYFR